MIERLEKFNNKIIDRVILFIFIDKLSGYDKQFYFIMKDKFIKLWQKEEGVLFPIKDLNLNEEELKKFYDWFMYFNTFENIHFES